MGKTIRCMMFSLLLVVIAISVGCGTQAPEEGEPSQAPGEQETSELPPSSDPFVGTWQLDLEKSTYDPGSAPRNYTRTIEDRGDGFFLMTYEGIDAEGNSTFSQYAYKRDSKDYPVMSLGSEVPLSISVSSVDVYTEEHILKGDGKVMSTAARTVSRDGNTLTVTFPGTDAQSEDTGNIEVYERQ